MGFFYDWVDGQWLPLEHNRRLTLDEMRVLSRRRKLLEQLCREMGQSGGTIYLYGSLLARALVQSDQDLMRQFGKKVAKEVWTQDDETLEEPVRPSFQDEVRRRMFRP